MPSERTEEATLSATVPEPLGRWLEERADDAGVSPDEFLGRLLAAYRFAESDDAVPGGDLAADVARLDDRVAALRDEYETSLADVRERVVDVKLDADGKAPADHEHADLLDAIESLDDDVAALDDDVEAVEAEVDSLHERVDNGFENYGGVLEYLTDVTADVEEKADVLARAVLDARERTRSMAGRASARAAADELARTANRRGVRTADCGECGSDVDVALLSAPECPFCGATFSDVRKPGGLGGLLGSPELVVGDAPALEGIVADDADDGDGHRPSAHRTVSDGDLESILAGDVIDASEGPTARASATDGGSENESPADASEEAENDAEDAADDDFASDTGREDDER